jgi:hypothetical protein
LAAVVAGVAVVLFGAVVGAAVEAADRLPAAAAATDAEVEGADEAGTNVAADDGELDPAGPGATAAGAVVGVTKGSAPTAAPGSPPLLTTFVPLPRMMPAIGMSSRKATTIRTSRAVNGRLSIRSARPLDREGPGR